MWEGSFEEIKRFRKEMNRLFDTFFGTEFGKKMLPDTRDTKKDVQLFREPLSDLKETDKELIATIEIPGVDKKDIQLQITENNIEVNVEKKEETKVEKKGYIKSERSYKGFYRSMSLPFKVMPEKTRASYKDGILEIVMPKVEKKKREKAKKIEIN